MKPAPEDERRLLDAVEHAVRGETLALTLEETVRYCETGELPDRSALDRIPGLTRDYTASLDRLGIVPGSATAKSSRSYS